MICKMCAKTTTLAALTCKLATVNPSSLPHSILHRPRSASNEGDLGFTPPGGWVAGPDIGTGMAVIDLTLGADAYR